MKKKTTIIKGHGYRIERLPAVTAKEYMDNPDLLLLMSGVSVFIDGRWVYLEDENLINEHVPDWETLVALEQEAKDFNFAFLAGWKFRRAPASNIPSVEPRYFDPFFYALTDGEYATLAELKTIYDLEDAFRMMDALITKRINEHYAIKSSGR